MAKQGAEPLLQVVGKITFQRTKMLLCLFTLLVGVGVWGITKIQINDNYAKRFIKSHPVRKADVALNKHFAGTYTAYLVLEAEHQNTITPTNLQDLCARFEVFAAEIKQ